jgi:hypothetical protein
MASAGPADGAAVDQPRDVGMLQAGEDLALSLEALDGKVGTDAAAHQLDRDLLLVLVVVPDRAEHLAHAATAHLGEDAVGADAPPRPDADVVRFDGATEERLRFLVRGDELQHLVREARMVPCRRCEKARPRAWLARERRIEQVLDPAPPLRRHRCPREQA